LKLDQTSDNWTLRWGYLFSAVEVRTKINCRFYREHLSATPTTTGHWFEDTKVKGGNQQIQSMSVGIDNI